MKKFLYQVFLFAIAFYLFDKIFYLVLTRSAQQEVDKRLETVLQGRMNKDLIVLGSSIGARDIIASGLERQLGLSSYNLSYPGSSVEFHEFILRTLVKFNSPPKILLLSADGFESNASIKFRYDRLYPLTKYNFVMNELIAREQKKKILSSFMLHRINRSNFDLRKKKYTKFDTILPCGSMPISFQNEVNFVPQPARSKSGSGTTSNPTRAGGEKAFKNILNICSLHNIKLLVFYAPTLQPYSSSVKSEYRTFMSNHNFFFEYDTTKKEIFQNKKYFHDETHLMRTGAEIFTNDVARFISDSIMTKH